MGVKQVSPATLPIINASRGCTATAHASRTTRPLRPSDHLNQSAGCCLGNLR